MSSQREILLKVAGMTCMSCVRRVDSALREVEGVREVEVRLREGEVRVLHDGATAPIEAMIEALREDGYDAAAAST